MLCQFIILFIYHENNCYLLVKNFKIARKTKFQGGNGAFNAKLTNKQIITKSLQNLTYNLK